MSILFLPLDIDMSSLNFKQDSNSTPAGTWMQYWDASFISEETIVKTKLNLILDQLPFQKITRLFYKTQTSVVDSHLDVVPQMIMEENEYDHIKQNEPCGYRIVIRGGTDKVKIKTSKGWVTSILPTVPCCYVLNSTEARHSVDFDEFRETIYVRGFIDVEKHKKILERSLKCYKEYAIYN
jgi:hypothetical protein